MKLTDTQMVILTAAAQRDDGSIHPLPTIFKGGAVTKVTQALLRKGLIAEAPGREDWPGRRDPYFAVTTEGVRAIRPTAREGRRARAGLPYSLLTLQSFHTPPSVAGRRCHVRMPPRTRIASNRRRSVYPRAMDTIVKAAPIRR